MWLVLLFLLALSVSGCWERSPKIIKLGLIAPFSGRYYATGNNILFAVKLAAGEWNDKGGNAGYRIEVVAHDDHNDAQGGALQAKKMIIDPEVVGVVGHISRPSMVAGASEYHKAGLAAITLGFTPEVLAQNYPRTLGISASDGLLAKGAANFISENGFRRVALVGEASASSRQEVQTVKDALAQRKIIPVVEREVPLDAIATLREAAEGILIASPDLVFFSASFERGAALLKELKARDGELSYLGGPTHSVPDFVLVRGDAVEGAYYISPALHPKDIPGAEGFFQTYRAKFGVEPTAWAALAYDASNIILTATEQALRHQGKPSRAAIAEALANIRDYPGLTGNLTPSAKGNLSDPKVHVYRIAGPGFPGELKWSGGGS